MFDARSNNSENGSPLRDKHLCAISEMLRNGSQLSDVAIEINQLRLESAARLSRAHDVVLGARRSDRLAKEQKRAAAFAFKGEEQLQRLILRPLDELSALLELPAAIVAEEEQRLRRQSERSGGWVSPISEEDKEKVLDEMMRRAYPKQSAPAGNEATSTEHNGCIPEGTLDMKDRAHDGDLRVDVGQQGQISELVLPGVPATSVLDGVVQEFLILLQHVVDLHPLLEELSKLGASGDQSWKEVWRRLRGAIAQEERMQPAVVKALASLGKDLSLKKRVRMEACASATSDPQQMRKILTRSMYEMMFERALYFNMYIGGR